MINPIKIKTSERIVQVPADRIIKVSTMAPLVSNGKTYITKIDLFLTDKKDRQVVMFSVWPIEKITEQM